MIEISSIADGIGKLDKKGVEQLVAFMTLNRMLPCYMVIQSEPQFNCMTRLGIPKEEVFGA